MPLLFTVVVCPSTHAQQNRNIKILYRYACIDTISHIINAVYCGHVYMCTCVHYIVYMRRVRLYTLYTLQYVGVNVTFFFFLLRDSLLTCMTDNSTYHAYDDADGLSRIIIIILYRFVLGLGDEDDDVSSKDDTVGLKRKNSTLLHIYARVVRRLSFRCEKF